MNYQRLILVGNATRDAERRPSQKGDVAYTIFGVGVKDAKDRTTCFPVTVFDPLGKALAKYISKDRQIMVEGRIGVRKRRFNVVVDCIQLGAHRTGAALTVWNGLQGASTVSTIRLSANTA